MNASTFTSWLEVAGFVALVAAVGVALWPVAPALALAGAGISAVTVSAGITWATKRIAKRAAGGKP